jgi:glycine/D-amino acid oxidase-like deaminating enzyme
LQILEPKILELKILEPKSMKTADWIVVGGGLAGTALGYELAKAGFSVMLLEQDAAPQNATRYSYGGIAYWSATTELMRQVCQEGIDRHRQLSAELEAETQFRELDLLLTIAPDADPTAIAASYAQCMVPPQLISAEAACEMEPLLDRGAIAAALKGRHGHVNPEATAAAYRQAMVRLGGTSQIAQVTGFAKTGDRVTGVHTNQGIVSAANVIVSAGGFSRSLLKTAGIAVPCYFTQAELIETPPLEVRLQTLVMPAQLKRFALEATAGHPEKATLWDKLGHEIAPPVLDAGVVQFIDGRLRMGQISRVMTDPQAMQSTSSIGGIVDGQQSESEMRFEVGRILPKLAQVPGQWHQCLVAFSGDGLPLVGAIPELEGISIFSGFSNPFAILPSLAQRFAQSLTGQPDAIVAQLSPSRFSVPAA